MLDDWVYGHHTTSNIMRPQTLDGSFTLFDAENIVILSDHFTKVFNSNVKMDWSML